MGVPKLKQLLLATIVDTIVPAFASTIVATIGGVFVYFGATTPRPLPH